MLHDCKGWECRVSLKLSRTIKENNEDCKRHSRYMKLIWWTSGNNYWIIQLDASFCKSHVARKNNSWFKNLKMKRHNKLFELNLKWKLNFHQHQHPKSSLQHGTPYFDGIKIKVYIISFLLPILLITNKSRSFQLFLTTKTSTRLMCSIYQNPYKNIHSTISMNKS